MLLGPDGYEIMPVCAVCGKRKAPLGRSLPLEMANGLCDWDCRGYRQEPQPSSYWRPDEEPLPGTREAEFISHAVHGNLELPDREEEF